ncbi:MAG: Xaa-Pro dipeptidyl-peptidase [Planctomycetota bacterium]|nr:Xaa-Pro dipeptidyl-peptidase [Planctomycetota bacterium]
MSNRPALGRALPFAALCLGLPLRAEVSGPAGPVFVDGQAQVVPAFEDKKAWIRHSLWVEADFDSDGDGRHDRLHVDVTRPQQTDTEGLKVPVVYETSPYFAGTAPDSRDYFWNPDQELGQPAPKRGSAPSIPYRGPRARISDSQVEQWVPRGFAVVHSESPGTGDSQGCPTVGGMNEALAPKAVIDWLNGRAKGYTTLDGKDEVVASWCTGKVGMTGTSYNGTLPLAAATTGVAGLEAIIPVSPNTSYYHYYRSNGLVRHPGGYMGEDVDVLYDFIHSGPMDRRSWCDQNVRDGEMANGQDRASGDYNAFWKSRDYWNQLGSVKAATLFAHGLNDWNVMPSHSVHVYEALKAQGVPTAIYLHQGGHGGEPPFALMNRWFTRYLYGVENGVEKGPRAWVVREDAKRSAPTSYLDYPNPDAEPVTLFAKYGGAKVGKLGLVPSNTKGHEKLVDDAAQSGAVLAQAAESKNRLLYAGPELKEPLHVSGTARVTLRLASSKPAANLSVWLVSLPWEEGPKVKTNSNLITRGWMDPQNRDSLEKSEPLVPGTFYDVSFDLEPDDQIVAAGERIGLMVFSSDHDFTLWPDPGTELTLDVDHTSLQLPVVGGAKAVKRAFGDGAR